MCKKIISFALTIVMIISIVNVPTMLVEAATISESEFASKISYLKTVYRDKEYWNAYNDCGYEGTGTLKCSCGTSCAASCSCKCGKFYLNGTYYGGQCFGFANKMSYLIFGSIPDRSNSTWTKSTSVSNYYAGDYVRVNNRHSIFITKVSGDTITYVDCNNYGPCQVKWDRTISKSSLKSITTYVYHLPGNTLTGTGNDNDTSTVVGLDSPRANYTYAGANNIEISGWIASDVEPTYIMAEISDWQTNLAFWDSPGEGASFPNHQYFKRFSGAIDISRLSSNKTYTIKIFSNISDGTYTATFNTSNITPQPTPPIPTDCIVHVDSPSGTYTGYNNIEITGWIASNSEPSYIMAEISGYGQMNLGFSDSPGEAGAQPNYAYFKRFRGVIEVDRLASYTTYTFTVFSNVQDSPYQSSFSTGNVEPVKYSVSFNGNGGTGVASGFTVNQGKSGTIPNTVPQKEGYTFLGWSTSASATSAEYVAGSTIIPLSNITLYAVWNANKYTVSFNANGGLCDTISTTVEYGANYGELPMPTRENYEFKGWYTSIDGGSKITGESKVEITFAQTLFAQWEKVFVSVGGIGLNKDAIEIVSGNTETLIATVIPSNATDKTVVWSSSDKTVATVENGVVTAVSAGNAVITATAGGISVSCNVTVTESVIEVAKARLTVGNVTERIGETMTIPVVISENPGIAGFKLKINYDNTVLTPVSIEKGEALKAGTLTSNLQQSGDVSSLTYISAYWSNPSNVTNNGEMLLVTFKVKDNAEDGAYSITATYESGDVTNQDFEDVGFDITNGSVNVISVVMGDIFNDGKVNAKDGVKLAQYLADWDITFTAYEETAADVFKDGKINAKDGVKLSQYLADWDVELMELLEVGNIAFEVGSAEAVGGYVDIPVTITNNSGVAGFKVKLNYDTTLLTPVSITKGEALAAGTMTSNIDKGGDLSSLKAVSVYWSNPANVVNTGVAFTVRFKVVDGVEEDIPVTLSYEEGDICDQSLNDLEVVLKDGKVTAQKEADYTIKSLEGVVVDGSFYAEAEITKNTDRDAVDTIVIAVYKDGILIDRIYMRSRFAKGQTAVFGGYLEGAEGATLKAFVWDSMTSMNTLSNAIEK